LQGSATFYFGTSNYYETDYPTSPERGAVVARLRSLRPGNDEMYGADKVVSESVPTGGGGAGQSK